MTGSDAQSFFHDTIGGGHGALTAICSASQHQKNPTGYRRETHKAFYATTNTSLSKSSAASLGPMLSIPPNHITEASLTVLEAISRTSPEQTVSLCEIPTHLVLTAVNHGSAETYGFTPLRKQWKQTIG